MEMNDRVVREIVFYGEDGIQFAYASFDGWATL